MKKLQSIKNELFETVLSTNVIMGGGGSQAASCTAYQEGDCSVSDTDYLNGSIKIKSKVCVSFP